MEKIIIENRTDMLMRDAIYYVKHVISQGRISESAGKKQYCFVTTWKDGTVVYAHKNKGSDRFVISKDDWGEK